MPEWNDATAVKVAYKIIKAQEKLLAAYRTGSARAPGAAIDYLNTNKERFLAYAERPQLRGDKVMADVNEDVSPVVQECIDIVAQQIAWKLFDPERAMWEDYPEIGEFDWERIEAAVERLSPIPPDLTEYEDAYKFLARRAIQ